MISSLSLAQSPSKPGTATVQNHRFQWLQLPPASSRQDPGPKISCRRAGALAEPGSPRHRRSQGPWAAPVGTGTGSSGLPANRGSTGRPAPAGPHHGCAPTHCAARPATTTSSQLRPSSSSPAAARCRRATACWAAHQPPAPGAACRGDRKLQRRRHRDEGTGLPRPHRPPGEPQPRPGQVRQLHPGALLRLAAFPEALPAALVGLQHRGGLGPTADRRVAGQPDQLQQPPQRSGDVQLASDPSATCAAARATGTPAAMLGDGLQPRSHVSEPAPPRSRRPCARPRRAAAQAPPPPPWSRIPGGSAQSRHQPIDPQPRHRGGAARAAGCGGTPSSLRATGGDAPRRRASRSEGREEQR